ncbi:uncharacterized protein LOC128393460 [Panonychus citri]|uniref:uncharacterized protein LOC128393460 n=1 Tax=Panonychus citri TaxID=50023 RepID=UPI002307047A|nr:uncharacterized protein LOC128393460 [Panonychus citri]
MNMSCYQKFTFRQIVFLLSLDFISSVNGLPCYSCISTTVQPSPICVNPPRNGSIEGFDLCDGSYCTKIWGFLDDGTSIVIRGCSETIHSSCNLERINLRHDFSLQLPDRYFKSGCVKVCRWMLCNQSSKLRIQTIYIIPFFLISLCLII